MKKRDFLPDHSGIILKEKYLDPMNIKPGTLAAAIGVARDRITELTQGMRGITPDTALRLAAFFNTTAQFWLNLQSHYNLVMAEEGFDKALYINIRHNAKQLLTTA